MTNAPSARTPAAPPRWLLFAAMAVVLVFMAAMVTQYVRNQRLRGELVATRALLETTRSEATLGAAAAEAQLGRYEPARQLASRFFSGLQRRILAMEAEERAPFQAILDQRDATITLLSRGDPAAAGALLRLFSQYRTALHGEERPAGG